MFSLQAEQLVELMLVQIGADHAQAAGVVGGAEAHLVLLGHVVEVEPLAVGSGHDALGTDDLAVVAAIQRREDLVELRLGEGLHRFLTPGGEHLVGVVMMVMLMVTAMVVFVFVVAALMVMVVMMMFFMVVIVIMVIVMMAAMVVVIMAVVVMMFVFMLVGLMLANAFGMSTIFLMFASVFVIISAVVLTLGKESKQKTLEELEEAYEN